LRHWATDAHAHEDLGGVSESWRARSIWQGRRRELNVPARAEQLWIITLNGTLSSRQLLKSRARSVAHLAVVGVI
jgi:hypothetical protein